VKKINAIKYTEYVSAALVIQHRLGIRLIILSLVTCLPLPYFFTMSHKWQGFLRKKILTIIYVSSDSLYNFYLKNLSFLEEMSEISSKTYIIINFVFVGPCIVNQI